MLDNKILHHTLLVLYCQIFWQVLYLIFAILNILRLKTKQNKTKQKTHIPTHTPKHPTERKRGEREREKSKTKKKTHTHREKQNKETALFYHSSR